MAGQLWCSLPPLTDLVWGTMPMTTNQFPLCSPYLRRSLQSRHRVRISVNCIHNRDQSLNHLPRETSPSTISLERPVPRPSPWRDRSFTTLETLAKPLSAGTFVFHHMCSTSCYQLDALVIRSSHISSNALCAGAPCDVRQLSLTNGKQILFFVHNGIAHLSFPDLQSMMPQNLRQVLEKILTTMDFSPDDAKRCLVMMHIPW